MGEMHPLLWRSCGLPNMARHGTRDKIIGVIMTVNFDCKKCGKEFNFDVSVSEESMRSIISKDIACPRCGKISMDDVLLAELGQSQMTEATWDL